MKTIHCQQLVDIPDNCTVAIKSRVVTVKGPRGKLTRNFKHLQIDIALLGKGVIKVEKWFSNRKELAAVNTVCSHIQNMFTGVTKGYRYKMKSVYAHFPINIAISEGGKRVDIRNFLGEKYTRIVMMPEGVTAASSGTKDEYQIDGNDIEAVSQAGLYRYKLFGFGWPQAPSNEDSHNTLGYVHIMRHIAVPIRVEKYEFL